MRERLLTTVVGSYPQPAWLVDRERLVAEGPPRVRLERVWRVPPEHREEAGDDAARLVVRELEDLGLDLVTDGEVRRESYFNRFATALDGIDLDRPGMATSRRGTAIPVPRVVGPVRRRAAVEARDARFLRSVARGPVKVTLPGPFTMSALMQDDHYGDPAALADDLARAVNAELRDLKAAGVDAIQLDEPYLDPRPEAARAYGVAAIDRALEGIAGRTVVHLCFGYAYVVRDKPARYTFLRELAACRATDLSIEAAEPRLDLAVLGELAGKRVAAGVVDLADSAIETPETIARRIEAGLRHLPPERLVVAPDCGMKYLPRQTARAKLAAMVAGARLVRGEA